MKYLLCLFVFSSFFVVELSANHWRPGVFQDTLKMDDLKVPDGFHFRTHKDVLLDLQLLDETDQPLQQNWYQLLAVDHNGRQAMMMSGRTSKEGKIELLLEVPLHITKLVVECKKEGEEDQVYTFTFLPEVRCSGILSVIRP